MPLKQIITSCCLLLCAPLIVIAQNKNAALLLVECEAVGGICEKQSLVRFRFSNGVLVSKDLILTTDTRIARYDLGQNRIYRNRYVITEWGDIVDVKTKQLLHNGNGDYVAAEGDRIIHQVSRIDVEGYFYFDLNTKRYARLRQPTKWALPGLLSPDQTKSVEGHNDSSIWLHRLNQKKKLLGSDFWVQVAMQASFFPKPPLFWLDDNRILTQRNNGEIVMVQLDGTVTPIAKVPVTGPTYSEPYFFRDPIGQIVYNCCSKSFVINVDEKTHAPLEWAALGFGFDAEDERNKSYGHVIRYDGKEIGRLWADVWSAPAIDGYVAFEYGDVGSNLGYPKGAKVWSNISRSWTVADVKWLSRIIGWVPE